MQYPLQYAFCIAFVYKWNIFVFFLSFLSYYQSVPGEVPEIPKQQVFGLATPEDFTLPPHHPLWTEEVYAAFNVPEKQGESSTETYESKVTRISSFLYSFISASVGRPLLISLSLSLFHSFSLVPPFPLPLFLIGCCQSGGDSACTRARHCAFETSTTKNRIRLYTAIIIY